MIDCCLISSYNKGITRRRKSKDRQYNDQKQKDKWTKKGLKIPKG